MSNPHGSNIDQIDRKLRGFFKLLMTTMISHAVISLGACLFLMYLTESMTGSSRLVYLAILSATAGILGGCTSVIQSAAQRWANKGGADLCDSR